MRSGSQDQSTQNQSGSDWTGAAEGLGEYLEELEGVLVDRSIAFAKTNGYARFTTTIRAAWVEAIRSLSEGIVRYLSDGRVGPAGPNAALEYQRDPRFATMREIARKHRSLGITLQLYLGLFKHLRRVYLVALQDASRLPQFDPELIEQVHAFFDETELSVTADWTDVGSHQRLRELQWRTRKLTLDKDRYVAIFESLRNPALLLDHARRLVHANQAALEVFVGKSVAGDSMYLPARRALNSRLETALADPLDPATGSESTLWLDTRSGRRCFDVRTRALHDAVENIALGHLLQLYDVTAYRDATEKAQQAERRMSRFLATMSHEIRTPLHNVLGAAELLRDTEECSRGTYLDVIQSAGQSLLQTLNNVLDLSKLENGPPIPRPVEVRIGPALETFCASASLGPHARRTMLSLEISEDVPDRVQTDWAMTRQILTNLVANAQQHDSGHGVLLRVRMARSRDAPPALRFEVVDHGPGLTEDAAELLFQSYDEVSARHTLVGGTGLGLAISSYLVRSMNGDIGFENTASGAIVWFEVPGAAVPLTVTDERVLPCCKHGEGRRCLLVDDDPVGAAITAHQLQRAGFEVDCFCSIGGAREAARATAYDAIVVDYLLPDGTGPDLVKSLRQTGVVRNARIVALTANTDALRSSVELSRIFHVVLTKPTDGATLAQALSRVVAPVVDAAPQEGSDPGLAGLSKSTVSAMSAAFLLQWSDFRDQLRRVRQGETIADLDDTVHRLTGSTAQLGLFGLESALRELGQRWDEGDVHLNGLLDALDIPAEHDPGWPAVSS